MKIQGMTDLERVLYAKLFKEWITASKLVHYFIPPEVRRERAIEVYMGKNPDAKYPLLVYQESAFLDTLKEKK